MVGKYVIYLRKSRADQEAERLGEGETLARHKKILLDFAKRSGYTVSDIYSEIVSGETIAARPVMQKLLCEVEQGYWDGVIVIEIERLARGDTMDQGLVAQTFKCSNTLIITPSKVYDPNNEFDEEYFEFGLFMSRREYKTINRRLQRGRLAAIKEGKYIAGAAPYGYRKVKLATGTGYTLEIVPEQADVVRLIYQLYTVGELQENGERKRLGMYLICKKLDAMHIMPMNGTVWSTSTVKDILTNPTYTGKVRWQWRKCKKEMSNGKVVIKRPKDNNCLLYDGLHPAIITPELFDSAQSVLSSKSNTPVVSNKLIKNPLTGLVFCSQCGQMMTRVASNTKAGYFSLKCPNRACSTVSSAIPLIERAIINALRQWISEYSLKYPDEAALPCDFTVHKNAIGSAEHELVSLNKQLNSTYDLLEKGIYDTDTFLKRNQHLQNSIQQLSDHLQQLKENYRHALKAEYSKQQFVPQLRRIVEVYDDMDDARAKNELLKSVIDHVEYTKLTAAKKGHIEDALFEITVFPRLRSDEK